jgi:hypothetical protein
MLEVYLFAAMFAAQILIMSILYPARLARHFRAQMARYAADRVPQLRPNDIDGKLVLYRRLNMAIALLGLVLLVALLRYMRQPDWDDGPVETVVGLYFLLQAIPLLLASWWVAHIHKLLRNALQTVSLFLGSVPGFAGPVVNIGVIIYAVTAASVYWASTAGKATRCRQTRIVSAKSRWRLSS